MPRFMLSVHSRAGEVGEPTSEEAMRQTHARLGAVEQEMAATGTWVFSGRLAEADTAAVVRRTSGEILTTDGPFVEAKEHIAGFYLIEAADLDAALGWAAKVTAAIDTPIEVRPLVAYADEPPA